MEIKILVEQGWSIKEITPLSCYRSKSYGGMYEGTLVLEKDNKTLSFSTGGHINSELPTLPKEYGMLSARLKFIFGNDAYWHSIQTPEGIYYSEKGWFANNELSEYADEIKSVPIENRFIADIDFTKLGLVKIA